VPASSSLPNASSTRAGCHVVPASSDISGAVTAEEAASRSSICTNSPDSGSVDHSALAVT